MGFDVSMGIGKWVKKPEELIQSHDMAAQTLQYRYLLGGNLLIDMEEQHPVQEIAIEDDLAELKEAMKTGQKEQVYQILIKIEDSIRQALMEKAVPACICSRSSVQWTMHAKMYLLIWTGSEKTEMNCSAR